MEPKEEQRGWTVMSAARLQQEMGGEAVDYPVRLAVCPKGHARSIPTRFSRAQFELKCPTCKRAYPFDESAS
jgi:hypothetical protein